MERRRSPRRKVADGATLRLSFADGGLIIQTVTVRLIDESDSGLGIASPVHLPPGTPISIRDESGTGSPARLTGRKALVRWCSTERNGWFFAGVYLETALAEDTPRRAFAAWESSDQGVPDYYEVMKLSASIRRTHAQAFAPAATEEDRAQEAAAAQTASHLSRRSSWSRFLAWALMRSRTSPG